MNKPLRMPQLSAVKPRTGLRRLGDLLELLVRQYELQNQIDERRRAATNTTPVVGFDHGSSRQTMLAFQEIESD